MFGKYISSIQIYEKMQLDLETKASQKIRLKLAFNNFDRKTIQIALFLIILMLL